MTTQTLLFGGDETLPDRVPLYPFHRPFGAMVVDGVKTIETRPAAWPRKPGWLAVYNCGKTVALQPAARDLFGAGPYVRPLQHSAPAKIDHEKLLGPAGCVIGMVWVRGSRLLEHRDLGQAFYWEPGRFAWELERPVRFPEAIPLAELGGRGAPQGFIYLAAAPLFKAAGIKTT